MIRYISTLFFAAISLIAFAQKEDNIWAFGYNTNLFPEHPDIDRIFFNFGDSLVVQYSQGGIPLKESNATICDEDGNLHFLSNGCYIETGDGEYVENSAGLNPGWVYDEQCIDDSSGYSNYQNMAFLSFNNSSSILHLFHIPLNVVFQPVLNAYNNALFYTILDRSANGGSGAVTNKNQNILTDTLHYDGLATVRHANGRDWWVVVAKQFNNKYYLTLLTPLGITVHQQSIGEPTWSQSGGEIVFSPDGTKMARFNCKDDLRIFDFDRCTGTLSNPIYIPIQDNADNEIYAGLAFSADGHYLYAAEIKRMLQFDMWAPDIAASMVIIAERDQDTSCNLGKSIGFMELGPDGMIYCRPLNGQSCMHRMKHPERAGVAAEFVQYYYNFDFSYKNLPHFPNFRLGSIDGSSCDTLGLDNHPLAGWRYDKTGGLGVDFTSVSWYEPDTWWWDFGDGVQSNERNPAHSFPAPGAYEVCLTVSNQYGSDMKCKWVWVSTVGSSSPDGPGGQVILYPNPTTGQISWTGLPIGEPTTVRVHDALGQLCFELITSQASAELGMLPDGLYFITLFGENGQYATTKTVILAKK